MELQGLGGLMAWVKVSGGAKINAVVHGISVAHWLELELKPGSSLQLLPRKLLQRAVAQVMELSSDRLAKALKRRLIQCGLSLKAKID